MKIGVILAAGRGSRLGLSKKNKTVTVVNHKPIIQYGYEAYKGVVDQILIVVGHKADSVRTALKGKNVSFVQQEKQLGTGDAARAIVDYCLDQSIKPETILFGNGDNMVFLDEKIVLSLIKNHKFNNNAITLLTFLSTDTKLDNGRIKRDKDQNILKIVESKELNESEKNIREMNSGFYCFDYDFVLDNISNIVPNANNGEYQLTQLIEIAIKKKLKVNSLMLKNSGVGMGINNKNQLRKIRSIKKSLNQ